MLEVQGIHTYYGLSHILFRITSYNVCYTKLLRFCEHDMEVVFGTAQSIMVMQQGQTIVQAEPEAVRQNRDVQQAYLGGV